MYKSYKGVKQRRLEVRYSACDAVPISHGMIDESCVYDDLNPRANGLANKAE